MKVNEGILDRAFRIMVGLGIISLAFWGPQTYWAFLGFVPLVTGIVGICPLYRLFGLNTCPRKRLLR